MVYVKNLPGWERTARLGAAVAMVLCGACLFGSVAGWVFIAVGAVMLVTGLVGFCPACALAGRRLDRATAKAATEA